MKDSVLSVCMYVLIWGLSASNWTGTQLGSCMTATGETGGSEIVSEWSGTGGQRPMPLSVRPYEQLTVGGTMGVPASCQRDHGVRVSLGVRPAGVYVCL